MKIGFLENFEDICIVFYRDICVRFVNVNGEVYVVYFLFCVIVFVEDVVKSNVFLFLCKLFLRDFDLFVFCGIYNCL